MSYATAIHYIYNPKTGGYTGCYDKKCHGDDKCPILRMNISSSNNLPVGMPKGMPVY